MNQFQHQPALKHGAVLILLYERAGGDGLRVLLTTRSKELRSHPGQTALPGGKVDESDGGVVHTAASVHSTSLCSLYCLLLRVRVRVQTQYREANEEVALPLDSPHVHTLCTLEPFVSVFKVVVTPVVAYLEDVSVLEALRAAPSEVARIFDHPLEALLDPELAREEGLVPIGSEDWPYEEELHVRFI